MISNALPLFPYSVTLNDIQFVRYRKNLIIICTIFIIITPLEVGVHIIHVN